PHRDARSGQGISGKGERAGAAMGTQPGRIRRNRAARLSRPGTTFIGGTKWQTDRVDIGLSADLSLSLWLSGGQQSDSGGAVMMSRGDAEAVGVEVHVAENVGQSKTVVVLAGSGFPEEEDAAIRAAAAAHQRSARQVAESPDHTTGDAVCQKGS